MRHDITGEVGAMQTGWWCWEEEAHQGVSFIGPTKIENNSARVAAQRQCTSTTELI